jgi:hypothetical protein
VADGPAGGLHCGRVCLWLTCVPVHLPVHPSVDVVVNLSILEKPRSAGEAGDCSVPAVWFGPRRWGWMGAYTWGRTYPSAGPFGPWLHMGPYGTFSRRRGQLDVEQATGCPGIGQQTSRR